MAWVKLHDGFPDHPKVAQAGWKAAWLYVCGLTYCGRFLTDGRIPKEQVSRLTDMPRAHVEAERLVEAGLWEDHGNGHYIVHDYTSVQTPAAQVNAIREAGKARAKSSYDLRAKNKRTFANPSREESSPEVEVEVEVENSSSSARELSTPERAPNTDDDEEDPKVREAKRRLAERVSQGAVIANPDAWLRKAVANIALTEYVTTGSSTPPAHPANWTRPPCSACDGLALVEVDGSYVTCEACRP